MEKILKWSPELAKNIWLELSPQRLILMPAIIALITALVLINGKIEMLMWVAVSGIMIIGVLWGIRSAADALIDEHNERTWDWQRMSIIGPWKLAMGKLFGSTIYNWYGTALCLVVYFISAPEDAIRIALLMVLIIITVQALVILLSLQMIRRSDERAKIKSNRLFIVGLVLIFYAGNIGRSFVLSKANVMGGSWYNVQMDNVNLVLLTAGFFCFWAVAGVYRSMRTELQFSDPPTWWLAFFITSFFFQLGFMLNLPTLGTVAQIASTLCLIGLQFLAITYFLALTEAKDVVKFRLLINALSKQEFQRLFENIPLWIFTLPIAFLTGLLGVVVLTISGTEGALFHDFYVNNISVIIAFWFALLGFALRDLGILLLLNFSSRNKRADGAMMVYLLLLYVILPLLFKGLNASVMFFPDPRTHPLLLAFVPLIEAAIIFLLVLRRWKQVNAVKAVSAA